MPGRNFQIPTRVTKATLIHQICPRRHDESTCEPHLADHAGNREFVQLLQSYGKFTCKIASGVTFIRKRPG